jgi:Protein kinase domain
VLAGYRLEEQIGRGGMAVVFRASDERLGRQVAVKILAPALGTDRAFRRRFVRESRAAALVDDPHIIPIFQAGESAGLLFIAMRLVSGGDVRMLVRQHGSLPTARAAAIVSPVASALDAAHAAGLVHRDVKPANMLLDVRPGRPDHVYLSDFGLSKGLQSSPGLTGEGMFVGTPHYVAPEQVTGGQVDGRADQYSLACAAFELLSGAVPFQGDQAVTVLHAHAFDRPPPLTSVRPGVPSAVDPVLARALAKAPANRYATCQDFAEALRAALGLPPYGHEQIATPGGERSGAVAGAPATPRDRAGKDKARRGGLGGIIAGKGAVKHPAAGRHRKRRWRWFTLAIVTALLLAGAGAATIAQLTGDSGGREPHLTPVPGSLQGITAVSAGSTWALGGGCQPDCLLGPERSTPLIARWDGIAWSNLASPVDHASLVAAAGRAGAVWLAGYFCAVGCGPTSTTEIDKTLVLRWDGHALSKVFSPSPGGSARLASVTTGPDGTAYAAGYYCEFSCGTTSEIDRTLLLSWNHGKWSRLRSESPGPSARLTGVSAGPGGVRWAVGYSCVFSCTSLGQTDHTLTLRSGTGGWSSVPSLSPHRSATLASVSVGPGGFAWAAGWDSAGTLTMLWSSNHWKVVSSPSPVNSGQLFGAQLFGVSAGPGRSAWAAGAYCTSGCSTRWPVERTLIMRFGNGGWQIVPGPKAGGTGRLVSVSAGSAGTAWVAGYSCVSRCGTSAELDRTQVLRWTGTHWTAG